MRFNTQYTKNVEKNKKYLIPFIGVYILITKDFTIDFNTKTKNIIRLGIEFGFRKKTYNFNLYITI